MHRILPILVVGIMVFSGLGAVALDSDIKDTGYNSANFEEIGSTGLPLTHNVFGEYGTATWCGYCKYAHGALKELYKENNLDFYYVSLVDDENTVAANRIDEYNIYGFPTVWWDGGYDVDVGAGSVEGAKATYTTSINNCGARSVPNVNIALDATWLGGTNMQVDCTVYNYESTTYEGTIRVYISEIASSEGWKDTAGNLYTFAFLDWAFNEDISISSGGSWSDSTTWDGSSHGYSSFSEDNTMLYAVVFNDEMHQGYSNPPSGNPFDAYYVDDAVEHRVGSNRAPNTPSNPDPEDDEVDVSLTQTLSWDGGDPDWFDDVYYDVYFEAGDSTPDVLVSNDQTDTTYDPGTLDLETTYYWQIVSRDNHYATADGPIWSFTTRGNDPPNEPSNPNPEDGETGVSINQYLSWDGGDPDGDPVTYDVYFGTNSNPPLVSEDQTEETYQPGTLALETTYYWKIVAEDDFGETATSPEWSFTTRGNEPPYEPSNPDPADGQTGVAKNPVLDWDGGDPDGDITYYDVYFGTDSNPPLVSEHQSQSDYEPGELAWETTYYWKIVSEDTFGETTEGPIWSFTVRAEQQAEPDLECSGNLVWNNVKPGETLTGSFQVKNVGEATSELSWRIDEYPEWGTWTFTPNQGSGLTPENSPKTIQVEVVAPDDIGTEFTGNVKVINLNDNNDFDDVPVTLVTPRNRKILLQEILVFIQEILHRFPILERIVAMYI
jgi:thiol-disulfide isomerase/thioredoxin